MSAEDNHSGPSGEASGGAAEPANHAPDSSRGGVVASHGEREKRAYVAPVEIPKRHQRMATIDMSKVRIAPDMKVQAPDPRRLPTQKLDIPPGALRPPPPPAAAEIADPESSSQPQVGAAAAGAAAAGAASPWSQNAGIDRSMLPSAAMAQPAPAQAQRIPSMPPTSPQTSSGASPAIWIAVVVAAALLGVGVALALRGGSSGNNADPVSSSAPIAIPLPGATTPTTTAADTTSEPEVVEPNDAPSAEATGTSPKSTAPRTAPRRTSPAPKTAPAPAPAPTGTTRPRLFN